MVLELVKGGELFDFLVQRGALRPEEALYFFQQIIEVCFVVCFVCFINCFVVCFVNCFVVCFVNCFVVCFGIVVIVIAIVHIF